VRRLIDYGRQLYTALQERTADVAAVTRDFGTRDIAAILRRIACGLERANALEARVVREAASIDAGPQRAAIAAPSARTPSVTPRPRAPRADAPHPRLARLPTPEEIAAQVRRRPIGVVITDICRDLGILPHHPLWGRLGLLVMQYGGRLRTLLKDAMLRSLPLPGADPPLAFAALPSSAPTGTGPP
jgi:hypothetical protein